MTRARQDGAFRGAFRATRSCVVLLLIVPLSSCGEGRPSAPTSGIDNVLLVTLDTTRADRLGCYGRADAQTPTLDALAARGVLYETCISVAPITLPTHATLLTGLLPFHHGARNNGTHHVPGDVVTLAERFRDAGFATGAVISAFVLDRRYGLDQGFASYDDDLTSSEVRRTGVYRQTTADDTVRRARTWLDERGDERWFLWVHLFDAHAPYEPPEPFATDHHASPYDGEIAFADAQLGVLLDAVDARGELERTLVVVTADHGESLGEHDEPTHGSFVYDATTHVPLVLAHPSLVAGRRVTDVVGQADVAPTLLALAGLRVPLELDGALLPGVEGGAARPNASAYSEAMEPFYNHGWSELRAIRDATHRYVRAPRRELYALAEDPGELRDLATSESALADAYDARLAALLPAEERNALVGTDGRPDDEARDALAKLGYVFTEASDGARDPSAARPDPKDKIATLAATSLAAVLMDAERWDEAIRTLRGVLAEDDGWYVRATLASALESAGRDEEALAALREAAELPTATPAIFVGLARLERRLGHDGWEAHVERAKELAPDAPTPWTFEGEVHLEAVLRPDGSLDVGELDRAEAAYRAAVERDERSADAWLGLALVAYRRGDLTAAGEAVQRAVELDPLLARAWFNLGAWQAETGDADGAYASYTRAAELDDTHAPTWIALGGLEHARGEGARAEACFRRAIASEPETFDARVDLGRLLVELDRPTEALAVLEEATRLQPRDPRGWRARLDAARDTGDAEATLTAALALLERVPTSAAALHAALVAYETLARPDDANALARDAPAETLRRLEKRAGRDPVLSAILARARAGEDRDS